MSLPQVDLSVLFSIHAQLERQGKGYLLGGKAPSLTCDPKDIKGIDCSGLVRYELAKATNQKLIIPDGSQNQRAWFEAKAASKEVHYVGGHDSYPNIQRYMTPSRLYICFIKPGAYGCGDVGHVWLAGQMDSDASVDTLESYGGHGPGSRNWNTGVLVREVYSIYELPTTP